MTWIWWGVGVAVSMAVRVCHGGVRVVWLSFVARVDENENKTL
jgi:hypothetical protein